VPWTLDALVVRPPEREQLAELYRNLGLKTSLRLLEQQAVELPADAAPPPDMAGAREHYETVLDEARFAEWLEILAQAELFAFDTETTSLNYMQARVVGVSFCVEPGKAAYVPFGHDYIGAPTQLTEAQVLGALKPLLENPLLGKVGHHAKYDRNVLLNHDIELKGIRYDTMLESYVLNSTASRHDLDSVAMQQLGVGTIHFEDVAGKGAKQLTFNQVPLEQAGPYAAEDADVCLRLHQKLWAAIAPEPALKSLLEDVEMRLVPVLSRIERKGVLVDAAMLREQQLDLDRDDAMYRSQLSFWLGADEAARVQPSGLSPRAVQPQSRPAPKAPSSPRPEIASRLMPGIFSRSLTPRKSARRSMARTTSPSKGPIPFSIRKRSLGRPSTEAWPDAPRGTAGRRTGLAQPVMASAAAAARPRRPVPWAEPSQEGSDIESFSCIEAVLNQSKAHRNSPCHKTAAMASRRLTARQPSLCHEGGLAWRGTTYAIGAVSGQSARGDGGKYRG
jgi:DNA polymerase-1